MYEISHVTCEHIENPVSIDVENPRFSWEVSSDQNQVYQSAYRIIVKKETGETVWDSGKTERKDTIEIKYNGKALVSAQKYHYQIISWNQDGEEAESQTQFFQTAFFHTGRRSGSNRIRSHSCRRIRWRAQTGSGWNFCRI